MNTVLKQLGIKHINSNPYRPQGNSRIENIHDFLKRTLTKFLSSSDAKWDKVLPFTCYCFNLTPTTDNLESLFFLIHGRDPLEGCAGLSCSGDTRYMGNEKGLILFVKLRKLCLPLAKNLQENRLLKTNTLECNKNFKSHHFIVGQLIAVKIHLKSMFNPKFISDYRISDIINKYTPLIQSPDSKTRKIDINNAKPVSAISAADNVLQDFKQSMLRREHTHPYNLHSSSMKVWSKPAIKTQEQIWTQQLSETKGNLNTYWYKYPFPITDSTLPITPCFDKLKLLNLQIN